MLPCKPGELNLDQLKLDSLISIIASVLVVEEHLLDHFSYGSVDLGTVFALSDQSIYLAVAEAGAILGSCLLEDLRCKMKI